VTGVSNDESPGTLVCQRGGAGADVTGVKTV
jgi:hypothetical protein